ncbi:MAG: hypothetical protein GTO41_12305, partial [Burkholderiales bacterium]|nr:hypothetical protein [Burkholderiales bacterium]
ERIGIELQQFEQLIVSLHSNEQLQYSPLMVGRLAVPQQESALRARWSESAMTGTGEAGSSHYVDDTFAFYLPAAARDEQDLVSVIVFGEAGLVQDSVDLAGASSLSGPLSRLAVWTDRLRHVTIVFTPTSLSNDEGQWLLSGSLAELRRPLSLLFDDRIRGIAFSLHLDDGCYWELLFDRAVDYPAVDLRDDFQSLL